MFKYIVIALALFGCAMAPVIVTTSGTIDQIMHFNNRTYIVFEGDPETYQCNEAMWFNPGEEIEIVETKRGLECQ